MGVSGSGLRNTLQDLIRPGVEALGYELIGIDFLPREKNSLVRIYIDSENGITVDDCQSVSHQVSGILEVEDPIPGRFTLEVSSPGFDRPLFEADHFKRFVGERARIKMVTASMEGRKNFTGVIQAATDTTVTILVDETDYELMMEDINTARLAPDYK